MASCQSIKWGIAIPIPASATDSRGRLEALASRRPRAERAPPEMIAVVARVRLLGEHDQLTRIVIALPQQGRCILGVPFVFLVSDHEGLDIALAIDASELASGGGCRLHDMKPVADVLALHRFVHDAVP